MPQVTVTLPNGIKVSSASMNAKQLLDAVTTPPEVEDKLKELKHVKAKIQIVRNTLDKGLSPSKIRRQKKYLKSLHSASRKLRNTINKLTKSQ